MQKSVNSFQISGRKVGAGEPCYIIAEAGVNHNGSLDLAIKLADAAKQAGADCVKYQTFKGDSVVVEGAAKAKYQQLVTDPKESQVEMLRKLELQPADYEVLLKHCKKIGIHFMSTPYNFQDVDFLERLGVEGYKLASMHLVEPAMMRYTAKTGKPLFIATGMATLAEIDEAVSVFQEIKFTQFSLMQCTTNYPSRMSDANLRVIPELLRLYPVPIGYSDHTEGNLAACLSVGLGASVVEKHFTLDRKMHGPDHSSSLDPKEMADLVKGIRDTETLLGQALKRPSGIEVENAVGMRRSIVVTKASKKGEKISFENIGFKRPAHGMSPKLADRLVGKVFARDLPYNHVLSNADVEWND